jgi:hypothetical protein
VGILGQIACLGLLEKSIIDYKYWNAATTVSVCLRVLIQICISHKTVCVCLYVQKEDKEKA